MLKLPLTRLAALIVLLALVTVTATALYAGAATVMLATVDGPISPGSAGYIESAITKAYANMGRIRVLSGYYRTDIGQSLWPPGTG